MDILLGEIMGGSNNARRLTVPVFESNPAVVVPTWARNGKSKVYVSAVGGGQGLGYRSGWDIANSAPGQACTDLPFLLVAGIETISVVIGAGGSDRQDSSSYGGNTVITIGKVRLTLNGGGQAGSPTLQYLQSSGPITSMPLFLADGLNDNKSPLRNHLGNGLVGSTINGVYITHRQNSIMHLLGGLGGPAVYENVYNLKTFPGYCELTFVEIP